MGRDGFLGLRFERRGARTVLTGRRFALPLQALEPVELDGSGVLTLTLLNPTGGLLGGDVLDTAVRLGPGARVCLTTPSASRVYRTASAPAVQRFTAVIGEGAVLEYVPDHLIPSPGARLRQRTEVSLGVGATVILVEAWAVGRIARGERWRFHELDLGMEVRDGCGLLLKERAVLRPEREWSARSGWERLGATEGMAYVAMLAALAPARPHWNDLVDELSAAGSAAGDARCGVTPLGRGGLVARVLAPSAPALRRSLDALWSHARRSLLGLPPLALRKL